MIGQVKEDSCKGDFVSLEQSDLQELKLHMTNYEIQNISKSRWKKTPTLAPKLRIDLL